MQPAADWATIEAQLSQIRLRLSAPELAAAPPALVPMNEWLAHRASNAMHTHGVSGALASVTANMLGLVQARSVI